MKQYTSEILIMNGKAATGIEAYYQVDDYQHVMFTLSSTNSGNFTIKFQWSMSDTPPDFAAAQTNSNRWDYVQVKDYEDNAAIDGDTGVAFAWTDDVRQFEMNTNGMKWVCARITAYSAGNVYVRVKGFNNQ